MGGCKLSWPFCQNSLSSNWVKWIQVIAYKNNVFTWSCSPPTRITFLLSRILHQQEYHLQSVMFSTNKNNVFTWLHSPFLSNVVFLMLYQYILPHSIAYASLANSPHSRLHFILNWSVRVAMFLFTLSQEYSSFCMLNINMLATWVSYLLFYNYQQLYFYISLHQAHRWSLLFKFQ